MLNALEPRTQALLLLVLPASLALAFTASVDCVMGDEDHGGYICCCCIAALHLHLLLLHLLLLHLLLLLLHLLLLLLLLHLLLLLYLLLLAACRKFWSVCH